MVWTKIESIIWSLFTVNPIDIVAQPYLRKVGVKALESGVLGSGAAGMGGGA